MNPRLTRPLLAVAVTGALLTGGSLVGAPASADPGVTHTLPPEAAALLDDPAPGPTATTAEPTPEPTATTEPTATPEPTPEPTATTEPTPTPTVPTDPDPADTVAPAGRFTLNSAALWIGQSVSLVQGAVTDDTSAPDQITRVAAWGDGTSSTLAADTATYAHKYPKNGKFTVTVTYRDAAGNTSSAASVVTVTTPGAFKLSKTTVWSNESFTVTFSKVPAGTTKIVFDQGDGYIATLTGKNQTSRMYLDTDEDGGKISGAVSLRATFHNRYGASSAFVIGKVTVKRDSWKPVTTVKKPKSSNRIKSWKYATGTAKDKGSGVYRVAVYASRLTGSKFYCYSAKNTWKRVTSDAQADKYCVPHYVKAKKGKWTLRLKGVAKGTLWVDAATQDVSANWGKFKTVKVKITRS
ncbi:PKD domain-containing protein [Actinoplanes sp. NPDC049599]|uniref:PKD domain-containing protein n=1 Tax=Actinoplanes sp. NPDC049599 TaxID=3363903 RepID=UPI0037A077C6